MKSVLMFIVAAVIFVAGYIVLGPAYLDGACSAFIAVLTILLLNRRG